MEVAFGISMFALQRYYGEKLTKERRAVEVIFHANELWSNCSELLIARAYFNLYGGPRPAFEEAQKRMEGHFVLLGALVPRKSSERQRVYNIRLYMDQALELLAKLRPVGSARSSSEKLKTLLSDVDLLAKTFGPIREIGYEINLFRDTPFLHSDEVVAELERATAVADSVVLGSLAASTVIAVLLFAYFIRSINQGVNAVLENTERFKQGIELKPAVQGGDELAQVDVAFYDMADEIKEAQGTKQAIVSMISHDLRSPLTSVLGYLTNLVDGAFGDPSSETIADAQMREHDVERLIRLISDLLDLDKIEAGRFELRPKTLLVDDVIAKAITAVTPFAEQNGVTIQRAESKAEIHADPDRIVQALANVLSTAIRLSPSGSRVETSVSQNNGQAAISVSSAGASISGDRLNLLFDRYQQGEARLHLELPISKEIIRLHGGTIGVTVQQPSGVTISLCLPSAVAVQTSGPTS